MEFLRFHPQGRCLRRFKSSWSTLWSLRRFLKSSDPYAVHSSGQFVPYEPWRMIYVTVKNIYEIHQGNITSKQFTKLTKLYFENQKFIILFQKAYLQRFNMHNCPHQTSYLLLVAQIRQRYSV
ncbi:hypothetical protein NPIL_567631 [Nephila pilipes]|uniref:Uncharacterized protein n=1 Tax=Nephila pilipes TaxID=299642 RepID=A0A8X6P491_NEPPI|nr:hypothetical protein NPIL_567631 [Nephila pilipes]